MIRFIKLHGVDIRDASLPQVPRTPEGVAMGAIPGWGVLLDPAYVDHDEQSIRNRALPNGTAPIEQSASALDIGEFANGEPSFSLTDDTWISAYPKNVAINPTAWSVVVVSQPTPHTIWQRVLSTQTEYVDNEGVNMRVGFTGNAVEARIERAGAGTIRLAYTGDYANRGQPSVLVFTSSTRDGLKIYDNGELVASNPSDTSPLTNGYSAGEWGTFNVCRGDYGMLGLLSIDLGWPEHAGYRRSIERFLMDKYGIS